MKKRRIRVALTVFAALAGIVLWLAMNDAMQPAIDNSDFDIVAFEFAGTPERATEILESWGPDGVDGAKRAIKLDYGFLVAYSALLLLGAVGVGEASARRGWQRMERTGWVVAMVVPVAGLLDAIENTALLRVISDFETGDVAGGATRLAARVAGPKFVIIMVAIIYVGAGLAALGAKRR